MRADAATDHPYISGSDAQSALPASLRTDPPLSAARSLGPGAGRRPDGSAGHERNVASGPVSGSAHQPRSRGVAPRLGKGSRDV